MGSFICKKKWKNKKLQYLKRFDFVKKEGFIALNSFYSNALFMV